MKKIHIRPKVPIQSNVPASYGTCARIFYLKTKYWIHESREFCFEGKYPIQNQQTSSNILSLDIYSSPVLHICECSTIPYPLLPSSPAAFGGALRQLLWLWSFYSSLWYTFWNNWQLLKTDVSWIVDINMMRCFSFRWQMVDIKFVVREINHKINTTSSHKHQREMVFFLES